MLLLLLLLWVILVSFMWWQASSPVWVLAVLNELFLGPVSKAVTNVNFIEGIQAQQPSLYPPHLVLFRDTGGEPTSYIPPYLLPGPDWMEETWRPILLFPFSDLDDA